VAIGSGGARAPAKSGTELRRGDSIEASGASAVVSLKCPDGTTLESQGPLSLGETSADPAPAGKTLSLSKGTLSASVARQAPGQAFSILTPGSTSTRVEVREGKVRVSRRGDRKPVDVGAGQFVVAAPGAELRPQPAAPAPPPLLRIDVEDGRRPELCDEGAVVPGSAWPRKGRRRPPDARGSWRSRWAAAKGPPSAGPTTWC
jgi:hypothetical protein